MTRPFLYLQRNADNNPHGLFSLSAHEKVTNEEALVSVKKLAFELRRMGVKPGDIVALDLPDQLGLLFTEAVWHESAVNTVLPDGYVYQGVFRVDWLFTSRSNPASQGGARVVHVDARFLQLVDQNPYGIRPRDEPIETLRIVFSSGTTGTPRAMLFAHDALVRFDDEKTGFQGYPFFVLMDFGTVWGFTGFCHSVMDDRPFLSVGGASPAEIADIAAQNAVESLRGSPAQIASLVNELERQQRTIPSIETVFVGGTVMPPGLAERMRKVAEGCRIITMYGSTEAKIATNRLYESDDASDAGQVLPEVTLEIVDGEGRILPMGETGRIRYRSPSMVHEYLGDAEATERVFQNGWFYPGDLGFIRPDRGLTLAGRASELLNAGGTKIDPMRLDHFALQNPKVIDACSFEYATASGIRQIGIALVTDDDIDVHALVADFKVEFRSAAPTLVARVESIPRNPTGKPMRQTLAESYNEN